MTHKKLFTLIAAVTFVVAIMATSTAQAQVYTIPWHTIDGGGGSSSGGNFALQGTIGQHDAGPEMTGGNYSVTGGYWVGVGGPITIAPDSLVVTRGTLAGGGLPELIDSDNADLSIQRAVADTQARTEFEVRSSSPLANPSSFEVTLEGSVFARPQVDQTIELYDYDADAWVVVDTSVSSSFSDSTVTAAASGDLSRFVESGTMAIAARVRYLATVPRARFASNTDQFKWTIQ